MNLTKLIGTLVLSIVAAAARAEPVQISWITTGQANNWTVDFTVYNNLQPAPADMSIYYFGVYAPARDIVSSPADWDSEYLIERTDYYASYPYNNNWLYHSQSDLTPGKSLSGFKIKVATVESPTVFHWYAGAYSASGGDYLGNDATFLGGSNPIFQRTTVQAVPEPDSILLLASGVLMTGLWRVRRRP